jgi:predicted MFS family arabinose efflux permease
LRWALKVPTTGGMRRPWPMLAVLIAVFALSHAFRTVFAVIAGPLDAEFGASAQALGVVAGAFHLAFALAQPVVGVALDRHGPRCTVVVAFLLALAGSAVSAGANSLDMLIVGQWLIGLGCAPALLAAMVFITRRYPADRFAPLSGVAFTVGGMGMLITATPLAWVVEQLSWRTGFVALGLLAAVAWLAVWVWVDDEPTGSRAAPRSLRTELRELAQIVLQRHTIGICCLAAVSYAAFMAVRGLWLGPLLAQRHDFSLVAIGHVAFAMPLAGLVGPLLFGRIDPGGRARRGLIIGCSLVYAALFAVLAVSTSAALDVALAVLSGFFLGYLVLQYADLRSAYPAEQIGRALSVFTMAMFGGVAAVQWLSGTAASIVGAQGGDPLRAALLTVAVLLAAGTVGFWLLPWPPSAAVARKP